MIDEGGYLDPVPESRLYSHESEYAVIGSMLKQPDLIDELSANLERNDFHHPACAEVFEVIMACHRRLSTVDIVTLAQARPALSDGQRMLAVAGTMMQNTPSTANAAVYAGEVRRRAVARRVIMAAQSMIDRLQDGASLDEVLASGQQAWLALEAEGMDTARRYRFISEILPEAIDTLDSRFNGESILGYDTGLPPLDPFLTLSPGRMIVIAGAPGSGKTTLGLNLAERVAVHHQATSLVFSFEMEDDELVYRSIASIGKVPLKHLTEGHTMTEDDWPRMTAAVNKLMDAPLAICDDATLTMKDIRQIARTVKRVHGLGAVVVDYIGLIPGEGSGSRYEQVSAISKALKRLAKELGVPFIVLAQLNRAPNARGNKRPTKSDLRDSGQIEADADVVVLVHRDDESDAGKAGVTELIVDKNRHGPKGSCYVQHQGAFHRFAELLAGYYFEEEQEESGRPFAGRQYGKGGKPA